MSLGHPSFVEIRELAWLVRGGRCSRCQIRSYCQDRLSSCYRRQSCNQNDAEAIVQERKQALRTVWRCSYGLESPQVPHCQTSRSIPPGRSDLPRDQVWAWRRPIQILLAAVRSKTMDEWKPCSAHCLTDSKRYQCHPQQGHCAQRHQIFEHLLLWLLGLP